MSPSIFSRGSNGGDQKKASSSRSGQESNSQADTPEQANPPSFAPNSQVNSDVEQSETNADVPSFREVTALWRAQMARQIRQEVGAGPVARLILDNAHPGGLAQLYAEHPTRLSNLVRDSRALSEAVASARTVLFQAKKMWEEHGTATIHLAIGYATWNEDGNRRSTPILLRPVDIEIDDDDEVIVTLRPGMEISNRLMDVLARHGSQLEPQVLLEQVRTPQGFSPVPALQIIKEAGQSVPGLELKNAMIAGVFVHPASALLRELGAPQWLSLSPVVRALAGGREAQDLLATELPEPNPHDRDPWQERGIGDQSPTTADVIEAATDESSIFVEVPGNAGTAQVVASIAAEHAAEGRQVLIVSGQPHLQSEIFSTIEGSGAVGITNIVDASAEAATRVQQALQNALYDASDNLDTDALDDLRTNLRRVRNSLSSYTESLHQTFPQWGISAFDALQVLTDLTSLSGGPGTKVRLSSQSLSALSNDQGEAARELLERASELGVFSPSSGRHWWTGVELRTAEQVDEVLSALEVLGRQDLPAVDEYMTLVAEQTGLRPATDINAWDAQLSVLRGVRDSLDIFLPTVFERSAADMVLATASKQWRKDHGINMSGSLRRRLQKQARDQVRPGRYVEDLHDELVLVQERREQWRNHCDADGWPRLPSNLDVVVATTSETKEQLRILNQYLAPVYGDLFSMELGELQHLVERLLADPRGAQELPERVNILHSLDQLGLNELVEDLRVRQVPEDLLSLELDLAWWASALGLMLAAEPRLGGFDPSTLQEALLQERMLDQAQVDSLGPAIRHKVIGRRRQALAAAGNDFEDAGQAFAVRASGASYYSRIPLSWSLVPIVMTSAAMVPAVIPWGRHVDVVILVGIDEAPLAELIPVIARGGQIVVVGNAARGQSSLPLWKQPATSALAAVLPQVKMQLESQRINDAVVRLLSHHSVDASGVSIPGRRDRGRVEVVHVDGSGMPAPGVHAIESSKVEVDEVVRQVVHHAENQPETSLAVIALTDRHAERINAALMEAAVSNVELQQFINLGRSEPFVISGPEDAIDLRRDRIILAVGFAKTPHGRVIHDFGPYSQAGGEHLLAQILRNIRGDLLLVTSIQVSEIDPDRVRQPGAKLLVDLLGMGGEQPDLAEQTVVVSEDGGPVQPQWPTLESAPDNLLVDLAERLYRLGLNVVPNLGVPGGMRIPLGIGHPEVPGELLVAILTDDEAYIDEPSLRVKDRLWPRLLEEQGWKVRTELSMAVFIDPNREAEAIVQLVLDAVDEFYDKNPELRPVVLDEIDPALVGDDLSEEQLGEQTVITWDDGSESIVGIESSLLEANPEMGDLSAINSVSTGDITVEVEEVESALEEDSVVEEKIDVVPEVAPRRFEEDLPERGPRPPIAKGLPLSAYGDDQLDEVAAWLLAANPEMSDDEAMEQMREALQVTRRGAQSDAVLRNVILRSRHQN